ncbi:MAG: hypothetical protein EKK51_07170 [Mycolicibacterium sp.]|jgi:hypothetical protein|uniref:hypothetical protein n=1 Tax=Mycolicibacterium sp. TaxID=2320850 RepID=UPI000928DC7E|nr:hypothetical protein [Mycolicibacterium sp.]RUP33146.1 MAG: hypothetical protein EKK51_07170 [Mycolicibacterium sp.]TXH26494.1 MAG: hypothetical protein E6R06_06420 [Mycobacterium sp.]SHU09048.1 Uncharacterised protein [Mycobacteroides abscessus subsp. abscessus]
MGWKRVGAVIFAVALMVVGCSDRVTDVVVSRAADHPLLRYLPTLADVPGMVEVGYEVPRNDEFSAQRRNECSWYPEPGDPDGPQLSAAYWQDTDRNGSVINVQLWRTRPGENVVDEMVTWGTRCATYRDVYGTWAVRTFRNIHGMPTDAIQFDTKKTSRELHDPDPDSTGPYQRTVILTRDGVVLRVRVMPSGLHPPTDHDLAQVVNAFVRHAAAQPSDAIQTSSVAPWPAAQLSALVMTPPAKSGSRVVQLSAQPEGDAPADCSADPLSSSRSGADRLADALEVATVLREHDGYDGIAAVNEWVNRCSTQSFVPEVCADKAKEAHLEATPPVRIEGELVSGYQGVVLGESYVKTTKYCQPDSVVAQMVRVRGILLRAVSLVVRRAEGEDRSQARRRALDDQRQQLAYVIHRVQRAR